MAVSTSLRREMQTPSATRSSTPASRFLRFSSTRVRLVNCRVCRESEPLQIPAGVALSFRASARPEQDSSLPRNVLRDEYAWMAAGNPVEDPFSPEQRLIAYSGACEGFRSDVNKDSGTK